MGRSKTISIMDIAKMAGVSVATVSHVMNNTGRFSKETELKVKQVIKDSGFVFNNAARSLKSSSSHTIGLILPNINNPFFANIASIVESYTFEHDYALFVCNTNNSADKEKQYFKKLNSMQVDGIIVISCQKEIVDDIVQRNIPIILIDRTPTNNMNLTIIASDAEEGIYQETKTLINKGCRNLVFISSFLSTYTNSNRSNSFIKALKESNIEINDEQIIHLPQGESIITTETAIVEYINSGRTIDGIICTSDNQAIGAIAGLKQLGLKVPEDVKVFGFDNTLQSQISTPTISTIERYPTIIGQTAAEVLMDSINKKEVKPYYEIKCSIIERQSTN